MIRDYTEKTKERLLKQIDEVNDETWCWLTDGLGDFFTSAGKWLGILNLRDDMSNVESYQKAILDKTDMTKKELRTIFENVYSVDSTFKKNFDEVNEKELTYNEKLQKLISMINPNFQIASSQEIMVAMAPYNDKLKNIDKQIAETYTAEMDWAAKEALKDAGKNFLKGLGKMAGGIGRIMSGNPTGAIDIINGFCQFGSSLETAINLGGYAIYGDIADLKGESLSDRLSQKRYFLDEAEKSADNKGISDVYEDLGWDTLATAADVVDTGADIINFANGLDKFVTGSGPKIFDGDLGFKIVDKSDDYINTLSKGWKNIKQSVNYLTPIYEFVTDGEIDGFYKEITEKAIPFYDQIQSGVDTVNDGVDMIIENIEDAIK